MGRAASTNTDDITPDSVVSPPNRDSLVASYGGVVEIKHVNSLWRRDLVYEKRGLRLEVRPMTPDDDLREADFFKAQSVKERIMRFMGVKNKLLPQEVKQLTHLDFDRDFAIVAVDRGTDGLAGIARYCRDRDDPQMAEVAVAVLQSYQRLGLARYLVAVLFDAAVVYGVRTLVADILRENTASRRLFEKVAREVGAAKRLAQVDSDVFTYHFHLPATGAGNPQESPEVAACADKPLPPPSFTVDNSRHPRSLWRHDLIYPSGLRVEVRPADPDDRVRLLHFTQRVSDTGETAAVQDLAHLDFLSGFSLVAIDFAKDEFVGVAHFHRSQDWSRLNVLTDPAYHGLGISDFLASEVLRAAELEVVPRARAAL
mmetsp:Transcript_99363/g.290017  ORF Transcript_99363/g.290017 Transcript_99363/m.290017 type:complete len:371 (-) Transcript_99363:128-1240(-)